MNLRFCYRIDKEAGWGKDEIGNPCEVYSCIKVSSKTYNMDRESYTGLVDAFKAMTADNMNIDINHITPITLNEYLDNTEEDDEEEYDEEEYIEEYDEL